MKVVFSSIILKNFAYYTTLNPRRWWIFYIDSMLINTFNVFAVYVRGVIEKFQDYSYFSFPVLDVATLY
jgi:hypothetical protein